MLSATAKHQDYRLAFQGDANNEIDRLNATINLVFTQLKMIKMQCINGHILDEVIERTEILAFNARNNPFLIDSDYMRSYQKNVWQLLRKLDRAEPGKSSENSLIKKYKRMFFELFNIMDESLTNLVSPSKPNEFSSLVFAM